MAQVRRCTVCVMDDASDPSITFDAAGQCHYCRSAYARAPYTYFPNAEGRRRLDALVTRLKTENRHRPFDCIMGISGGLDSSYLAYQGAAHWGLRILALHIDDGYDTPVAKSNIAKLVDATGITMETIRPDPHQFNELTRAFFLAGVPNLAIPQDNILFAEIYRYMRENKLRSFLSGGNFSLESILQKTHTSNPFDITHIRTINRLFGRSSIDKLTIMSEWHRDLNRTIRRLESPRPLNLISYRRDSAMAELDAFCGFEYYGAKHTENVLTRFAQVHWFFTKFGVDKRKAHLSSMIVSDQMDRETALELLAEPIISAPVLAQDIAEIKKTLALSDAEYDQVMAAPSHQHDEYGVSRYTRARGRLGRIAHAARSRLVASSRRAANA